VFRRAVGTKELLSLVEPNERVVGAVVFGVAKFVAGRCRRLVRGRVRVSVEVARLVQELRLDVFDGRREGPEFLTEFLGVRLRLLAIVTDHEDELVDDVVEDGLGDGGGVSASSPIAVEQWVERRAQGRGKWIRWKPGRG
jgi:hypothetical protein